MVILTDNVEKHNGICYNESANAIKVVRDGNNDKSHNSSYKETADTVLEAALFMKQIVVVKRNGSSECYPINTLPFSSDELENQMLSYYNGRNCDRCRNAILQSGIAGLLMDIEMGIISDKTHALFPILSECVRVYVKEK